MLYPRLYQPQPDSWRGQVLQLNHQETILCANYSTSKLHLWIIFFLICAGLFASSFFLCLQILVGFSQYLEYRYRKKDDSQVLSFSPTYIFYAPDTRSNVTAVWFCSYATALLIVSELVQLYQEFYFKQCSIDLLTLGFQIDLALQYRNKQKVIL